MVTITYLILSGLAVYFLSLAISSYDGPLHAFRKARENAPEGLGQVLSCNVCLSPYISVFPALWLARSWQEFLLYTFGTAGAAVLTYRIAERG